MSNGTITLSNQVGKYDFDVTTFQMAVLFCWENRRNDRLSLENLRLATELPETELRKTLWGLVAFPKLKRQVLLYEPQATKPSEFTAETLFWINHDFGILKNGKLQKRGKINLIGRLQLSTERARKEENEGIIQLRILRTQEAIIKILKMRKVKFAIYIYDLKTTYLYLSPRGSLSHEDFCKLFCLAFSAAIQ